MSSETPHRPLPRHPRVWLSRIKHRWPFLVWVSVAALAVWLYDHGGDYLRINGMVEVTTESVAPLETGRLLQVLVIPGQEVEAGEVVAQMDTSLVDEEIAVLTQRIQQDKTEEERRFATAKERIKSELRDYALDEMAARSELTLLKAELERLEGLQDTGFVDPASVASMQAKSISLDSEIDLYVGFRKELEMELADLEKMRNVSLAYHLENGGSGNEISRLSLLRRRRDDLTLRAQRAGVISRVRREPGEVLRAGERAVDIITSRPRRILAFMSEVDTRPVKVGDILEVQPAIGGKRFPARIEAFSPNLIALEDRASPLPQRMVRGRRLELVPLEEISLTPGTSIIVYLPAKTRFKSFVGGPGE